MAIPLTSKSTTAERKARVAELSELWYRSCFSVSLMVWLVEQRRQDLVIH